MQTTSSKIPKFSLESYDKIDYHYNFFLFFEVVEIKIPNFDVKEGLGITMLVAVIII